MQVSGIKKIFLAQVAEFRANFARDFQMVVDNQADVGTARDGQDCRGHAADIVGRGFLGAELDQVRAAVAQLLGKDLRRPAVEIGRVNKCVKAAVRERFHGDNLTANRTKDTKEFADSGNSFQAERGCPSRSGHLREG